jgi:RNA-binding protein 39
MGDVDAYLEEELRKLKASREKREARGADVGADDERAGEEEGGSDAEVKGRKKRSSGRHREGDVDGDRHRGVEKQKKSSRRKHDSESVSRSRSRSRGSKRRHRDKDRERKDSRDRQHQRDDSRDRRKRKSGSRERDRDHHHHHRRRRYDSRDNDAGRRGSRRARSRSRDSSESPGRRPLTAEEKEAAAKQAAIDELTRDQRTVFVNQLTQKVREKDLKRFFETCGKVKDIRMLRDKFTNRHKGFAYVEMRDLDTVPLALQYSGTTPDFQKFPILVKASEAEKNFLAREEKAAAAAAGGSVATEKAEPSSGGAPGVAAETRSEGIQLAKADTTGRKLIVTNVHPDVTETDLQTIVSQFGSIESVTLSADIGGGSSEATVLFKERSGASLCVERLNGLDIAGKALKVALAQEANLSNFSSYTMSASTGTASGNWKLDDDSGSGVALNSGSRAALMAKLAQGAGIVVPVAATMPPQPLRPQVIAAQAPTAPAVPPVGGVPSFCILIKNMFNPAEETEDEWDIDIKEDVEAECRKHGGNVLHSYVDAVNPSGLVYVMFQSTASAVSAARALHGRWFAARMVVVEHLPPTTYAAKFPEVSPILAKCS